MLNNEDNKKIYEISKKKHIEEGGTAPIAYALTQIIKKSIEGRNYKIYKGGGPYGDDGQLILKKFDVVVNFTLGGDPEFYVVMDHDGDFCDIYRSNEKGEVVKKMF